MTFTSLHYSAEISSQCPVPDVLSWDHPYCHHVAEAPVFWPPDANSLLTGKDPVPGKDGRREKGMTEHEMAGWRHPLNGHEFEQILGDSERQEAWNAAVHGVTKSRTQLND